MRPTEASERRHEARFTTAAHESQVRQRQDRRRHAKQAAEAAALEWEYRRSLVWTHGEHVLYEELPWDWMSSPGYVDFLRFQRAEQEQQEEEEERVMDSGKCSGQLTAADEAPPQSPITGPEFKGPGQQEEEEQQQERDSDDDDNDDSAIDMTFPAAKQDQSSDQDSATQTQDPPSIPSPNPLENIPYFLAREEWPYHPFLRIESEDGLELTQNALRICSKALLDLAMSRAGSDSDSWTLACIRRKCRGDHVSIKFGRDELNYLLSGLASREDEVQGSSDGSFRPQGLYRLPPIRNDVSHPDGDNLCRPMVVDDYLRTVERIVRETVGDDERSLEVRRLRVGLRTMVVTALDDFFDGSAEVDGFMALPFCERLPWSLRHKRMFVAVLGSDAETWDRLEKEEDPKQQAFLRAAEAFGRRGELSEWLRFIR